VPDIVLLCILVETVAANALACHRTKVVLDRIAEGSSKKISNLCKK
jgi:hypothetical protein